MFKPNDFGAIFWEGKYPAIVGTMALHINEKKEKSGYTVWAETPTKFTLKYEGQELARTATRAMVPGFQWQKAWKRLARVAKLHHKEKVGDVK